MKQKFSQPQTQDIEQYKKYCEQYLIDNSGENPTNEEWVKYLIPVFKAKTFDELDKAFKKSQAYYSPKHHLPL